MPRRRDPVPRARAAGHWLGGILVLGLLSGGVVAAAVLLWENLDVRQLAPALTADPGPLPDPEPPVSPAIQPGSFPVVLFSSERNRRYYPDRTYYAAALAHWRGLIEDVGGEVREARSLEGSGILDPGDLLVVAEAPCLSSAEVEAIQAHLDSGGGLVSNWAIGARDEDCEWRGWGTIADLTGAGDVRELTNREALYLTVPGGMALSPGLDPGTRIEFRPEPSMAIHLPGPRVYWSDWALNPAPDESGGGADVAAATFREPSGARGAWFGFRLSQAATPRDSVRLDRLVKNGLLWAAGRVQATPGSWPDGMRSALLLIEDVEAEYENASAMADLLVGLDLKGTFFAVSQLVLDNPDLGRTLVEAGEVGSQTSDHLPVAGLTFQDQAVRLRRSWAEIRGWTGLAPLGLRPPEEAFDANTLRAWKEAGGTYVLAVNQGRSGSPELHRSRSGEPVILLPRLLKDDYNIFVQEGALRVDQLTQAFLEGTEKLRAVGGLAVVAVHTQIIGTGRRLNAVREVAGKAVSEGDWWITTAGDVAGWWRARSGVSIKVVEAPSERDTGDPGLHEPLPVQGLDLQAISSDSIMAAPELLEPLPTFLVGGSMKETVRGLWINVVLPAGADGIIPSVDGVPVSYNITEWGVRIPLGDVLPGVTRVISFRRSN